MGAPQGGPLSPILANILLDKLDKELEKRGLRFARYADDMIVLCKSKRAATRVFESLTRFIEKKRECQDFCVWGGYSRGSPTRLPFVFCDAVCQT